jgi:hypothetical protein
MVSSNSRCCGKVDSNKAKSFTTELKELGKKEIDFDYIHHQAEGRILKRRNSIGSPEKIKKIEEEEDSLEGDDFQENNGKIINLH